MYTSHSNKNAGFTLVEMLMVILIIAATTKIVAVSMEDFGFAARYEHTISRLDTIRKAIIGNPKRTVNGQPDISGFVADMGRLPDNVRELIQSFVCINTSTNTVLTDTPAQCIDAHEAPTYLTTPCSDNTQTTQAACEALSAPNNTWVGQQSDAVHNSGLAFGWSGPYLSVSGNPNNTDTFTDGWGNESVNNYGWVTCLWDDGDDIAGGGLANNLPNDTDADGLANCSNTQIYPNYTIYSLGRNGAGDVDADGAAACDNGSTNDYDGDCNGTILEEDYTVDFTNGFDVNFNVPKGGLCSFTSSILSAGYKANQNSCKNSGGQFGHSCYFTPTTCNNSGGTWNFTTASCDILNLAVCENAPTATPKGFSATWDTTVNSCHFTKTECTARSGKWRGVPACQFDSTTCADPAGANATWSTIANKTEECTFNSTNCVSASGAWDAATKSCDFTPTHCETTNSASWGCVIDRRSCGSLGGFWNYCEFTPDQCNALTGGSWVSNCHLTSSRCTNTGGTWEYDINTKAYDCSFTSSTCPTALGANWNGTSCIFPNTSCFTVGGTNLGKCILSQADCGTAGGIWDSNTKQCGFTSNNCLVKAGVPRDKECYLTHAEATGARFTKNSCEATPSGEWIPIKKQVCMNVFHRGRVDSTIVITSSNPVTIEENGNSQAIHFSFDRDNQTDCESNMGAWINASCTYFIAMGINAVGIYEYDGDCNTGNNLYPYDRVQPVPIQVIPNTNLPIINW